MSAKHTFFGRGRLRLETIEILRIFRVLTQGLTEFCYFYLVYQVTQLLKNSLNFNVWYLDDGALRGSAKSVLTGLDTITMEFKTIFNYTKYDLFIFSNISEQRKRKIEILKKFVC